MARELRSILIVGLRNDSPLCVPRNSTIIVHGGTLILNCAVAEGLPIELTEYKLIKKKTKKNRKIKDHELVKMF